MSYADYWYRIDNENEKGLKEGGNLYDIQYYVGYQNIFNFS